MLKVSVIIPTCNRPDLLPRAIKSVLSQIYQDFEIIVVDDGDKRSAENVVRQFKDNRIKYIKHVERKGGAAARNTGIKAAQGEFIAFLDDDDEWLPKKLEIQMRQFENTPNDVGFCFSAIININADGEKASGVPDGIGNYLELSLRRFKGFMTSTL
ncbi:MAG: glycosyl transferase, partial [Candidatus Portnoybacteria bacterium CG_4_9_14_3_um_filter_44_9]